MIVTTFVPIPETHRDLLQVQTAVLATIGPDGLPQVTATWFRYDEDDGTVKMWLLDKRQKTRNMRTTPRATLFVLDPHNQFRTLEIRAEVAVTQDPDLVVMKAVAAKYGIPDFSVFDEEGDTRSVVTMRVVKVNVLDQAPPDWESVLPR